MPATPSYLSRSTSTPFASPGGSYGYRSTEDESIVLEIGARYLRGGFSGEPQPRCTLPFRPDDQRRVGDYRAFMPTHSTRERRDTGPWGQDHELWKMDLRGQDLGLVQDKLERALRKAYNEYFLLDKPRKVLLTVQTGLSRPLLETVLSVLFGSFVAPSVTLMSSAVLVTAAAGLRSGLVIDIGWAETTITGVYEFREVHMRRTIRAGKLLSRDMAALLEQEWKSYNDKSAAASDSEDIHVTFDQADEVLSRMGWCMSRTEAVSRTQQNGALSAAETDPAIPIPLSTSSPFSRISIPFSKFALPVETALFTTGTAPHDLDTHNQPLPLLAYTVLRSLSVAPRDICMARLVFTGGCSQIPGLKTRLTDEVAALVQDRGWDVVQQYSSKIPARQPHNATRQRSKSPAPAEIATPVEEAVQTGEGNGGADAPNGTELRDSLRQVNASSSLGQERPHATLAAEAKREQIADKNEPVKGIVRGVESLGAWAGGSLMGTLRTGGRVEIEREKFMREGLGPGAGIWG